jgi:hypothetical protein
MNSIVTAIVITMALQTCALAANIDPAVAGGGGVSCANGKCVMGVQVLENGIGGSNTIIVDVNARQVCQVVFPNSTSQGISRCRKY